MIHRSKVYDMNRMAGEIYYQVSQTYHIIFIIIFIIIIYNIYLQPMIQYIESKEYSGFNPRIPSHIALLMTRYLPTVLLTKILYIVQLYMQDPTTTTH